MGEKLTKAIMTAAEAHEGQTDKSGAPYILHPLRVMLAMEDEPDRIVAILHDVVEDSDLVGHGDVLALFGADVHEAVYALTRRKDETYAVFIDRVNRNDIARRVKIADINDNLRPGAPHLEDRYRKALAVLSAGRAALREATDE